MKRVLDLSLYNKKWNFVTAKSRGIHGVILKASQGTFADPFFQVNLPDLLESGLEDGAYHYFKPSVPAVEQADKFYSLINSMPLKLGAWLDLEYNAKIEPNESPYKFKDYCVRALVFLMRLEELGVRAGIYTNPSHSYTHLYKCEVFAEYDLWIANPQNGQTRTVPNVPVPFAADSWRGWQYTWKLPNPAYYGAPADAIKGLDGSVFRW